MQWYVSSPVVLPAPARWTHAHRIQTKRPEYSSIHANDTRLSFTVDILLPLSFQREEFTTTVLATAALLSAFLDSVTMSNWPIRQLITQSTRRGLLPPVALRTCWLRTWNWPCTLYVVV